MTDTPAPKPATTFDVAPTEAGWYWCAVVERANGETDYADGYAAGARPTVTALRATGLTDKIIEWQVRKTPHGAAHRAG